MMALQPGKQISTLTSHHQGRFLLSQMGTNAETHSQTCGKLGTLSPKQDGRKEFLHERAHETPWERTQEGCNRGWRTASITLRISKISLCTFELTETQAVCTGLACTGLQEMGS